MRPLFGGADRTKAAHQSTAGTKQSRDQAENAPVERYAGTTKEEMREEMAKTNKTALVHQMLYIASCQ